jgi:hypothetical protein
VSRCKTTATEKERLYESREVYRYGRSSNTISVAVRDVHGKLIMEGVLETKAATILELVQGLSGTLALTFEEGTSAAWLHDLRKPHVSRLVVCDPQNLDSGRGRTFFLTSLFIELIDTQKGE